MNILLQLTSSAALSADPGQVKAQAISAKIVPTESQRRKLKGNNQSEFDSERSLLCVLHLDVQSKLLISVTNWDLDYQISAQCVK